MIKMIRRLHLNFANFTMQTDFGLMLELISIHIPKTGGRSVRRVLKKVYGDSLYLRHEEKDYANRGRSAQPLEPDFPDHIRALHVHLGVSQLMPVIEAYNPKVITWLRDPVERVISNYFFLMKRADEKIAKGRQLDNAGISLMEYVRHPRKDNKIAKFLEGMELKDFYFIGLLEKLEEDVAELSKMMGWKKKVRTFHTNDNTDYKNNNELPTRYHEITNSMRQEIAEINREDVELYEEVKRIRGII